MSSCWSLREWRFYLSRPRALVFALSLGYRFQFRCFTGLAIMDLVLIIMVATMVGHTTVTDTAATGLIGVTDITTDSTAAGLMGAGLMGTVATGIIDPMSTHV